MTNGSTFGYGGRQEELHEAVGAYVLGLLEDAEAADFEAHLAGCESCAAHLEEFSGVEPMLAALADFPATASPGARAAPAPAAVRGPAEPGPQVLDGLLTEVTTQRTRRRRRFGFALAAAVALMIGGPVAVVLTGDGDDGKRVVAQPHSTSPAEDAFFHDMDVKVGGTDGGTDIAAVVGMEKKAWGTHAVLELKNVKGPLKCNLVAVGKDGTEVTVTSWSVPKWGYGIEGSDHSEARNPLYVHGGAAMEQDDIDRFEVRTLDGERLVSVDA